MHALFDACLWLTGPLDLGLLRGRIHLSQPLLDVVNFFAVLSHALFDRLLLLLVHVGQEQVANLSAYPLAALGQGLKSLLNLFTDVNKVSN